MFPKYSFHSEDWKIVHVEFSFTRYNELLFVGDTPESQLQLVNGGQNTFDTFSKRLLFVIHYPAKLNFDNEKQDINVLIKWKASGTA